MKSESELYSSDFLQGVEFSSVAVAVGAKISTKYSSSVLLLSRLVDVSGRVNLLLMLAKRGDLDLMLAFRIGLQVFLTGVDNERDVFAGSQFRRRGLARADKRAKSGALCCLLFFFVIKSVSPDIVFFGLGEALLLGSGDGLLLGTGEEARLETDDELADLFITGDGIRLTDGEVGLLGDGEDGLLLITLCCCCEFDNDSIEDLRPNFALLAERNFDVRVCAGDNDAFNEGGVVFVDDDKRPLEGRLIMGGVEGFSWYVKGLKVCLNKIHSPL